MDFFKELYNGDIYPAEEIAVDIASDPTRQSNFVIKL